MSRCYDSMQMNSCVFVVIIVILSEAVCDGFSWTADHQGNDGDGGGGGGHLQVVGVWREGRPMDEALYVRERCLMASRHGSSSSSSWKRGVPVISAASGRSPGLQDSMLRTILSWGQRDKQL